MLKKLNLSSVNNTGAIKDSGERQQFSTGAQRDTSTGKGDFGLLPWVAIRELAIHTEEGAKKYEPHNWRKGIPYMRYFSSAMRHLIKWMMGYKDEPHLRAALWNVACLLETERMVEAGILGEEMDDRYTGYLDQSELWMQLFGD